mgnify:FL=1
MILFCYCIAINMNIFYAINVEIEIYDSVYLKNSLYEFGSALFVQMLHYFGFSIQLVYATCFKLIVKNLAFDTSNKYHKCMVFYAELDVLDVMT